MCREGRERERDRAPLIIRVVSWEWVRARNSIWWPIQTVPGVRPSPLPPPIHVCMRRGEGTHHLRPLVRPI
jgi:hypothetical protein